MPDRKQEIINASLAYHRLSDEKREFRKDYNSRNWDMWNLHQDYSHKAEDQSQEFIPKMSVVLEQLVSTVLQALTAKSSDYFTVEQGKIPDDVFTPEVVHDMLLHFVSKADSITVISDALRYVGLDGLVTVKVCSAFDSIPRFEAERGIKFTEIDGVTVAGRKVDKKAGKTLKKWRLAWDLIPFDEFHFDPNPNPDGGKLFEEHIVERDLHDLVQFAKDTGIYDMGEINQIQESFILQEEKGRSNQQKDEPDSDERVPFRKRVTIREFWGTLLDQDGKVIKTNAVWAIANDEFLIRPPEDNPRFDGQSPFVTAALIRNPKSVYGKGMMDASALLNQTFNELTNLTIDGAAGEAQNVLFVNKDALEEPKQVEDGLSPGVTLITNNTAGGQPPAGSVQTGRVPGGTLEMINRVESWLLEAGFANELKLGQLPAASTKATAIVESQQSIAGVFGALSRVFENNFIVELMRKSWATILANTGQPHFLDEELVNIIGADKTKAIMDMDPDERFHRGMFAGKIKVNGISGFVNRLREFQKLTTLLSVISGNPLLMQEFQRDFAMSKMLAEIIKSTGIREDSIRLTEEEKERKGKIDSLIQNALAQAGPADNGGGARPTEASGQLGADLQGVPKEVVQ